jgi:hypothetical protein
LKLLVNYENNVKNATSLKTQFENWYLAMPVLSLNGSKYDINLKKQYLHKSLKDCGEEVSFTIKGFMVKRAIYNGGIRLELQGEVFAPSFIILDSFCDF